MEANKNYQQMNDIARWEINATFAFCLSYFLIIFGGDININDSFLLMMSSMMFSISLPLSGGMSLFHLSIIERCANHKKAYRMSRVRTARKISSINLILVYVGFCFTLSYINTYLLVIFLPVSFYSVLVFNKFYHRLK